MPPFSVLSNLSVAGTSLPCFNPSLFDCSRRSVKFQVKNGRPFEKYRHLSASVAIACNIPYSISPLSCCCYRKPQPGSASKSKIVSQIGKVGENNNTRMRVFDENRRLRMRRFSLRLRPRLRLLSFRFRRALKQIGSVSFEGILEGIALFMRKNMRAMTVSSFASIGSVFALCLFLLLKLTATPTPKAVPYSDLITSLQGGTISKVLFEEGSRRIFYKTASVEEVDSQLLVDNSPSSGTQSAPVMRKARAATPEWQYFTRKIDHDEKFLLRLMREKGTTYSSAPQSPFALLRSILFTVLSVWIPLTPVMWLLYRQLSAANSPAKRRRPSNQMVSFDDVEGVGAAKAELTERLIVSCLHGAISYSKLGAKLPRGVLLVGPPGTGKTLLARAVAGEAGVPFFTASASEFVELFVGRGAARIRDLFNVARKSAPSIIFIDELDAVGGKRGRSFNDERDQTLNQAILYLL
ncbi:putative inactive ATP-dependent zinc metalloprotease FTSHI 3, chloroplastic [Asimina triloba]